MSVKNLHSLLNDRWFINEQYGQSLLPLLFTILDGKSIVTQKSGSDVDDEEDPTETHYLIAGRTGIPVAVKSFSGQAQEQDYVGIINLKSPIYKYNQECGPAGTKSKMAQMQFLADDPNCLGVVLDIDSGGGQVSGTPEFHDFAKSFPKPVVSYTDGLMCSAAYYIGSAAKHVIANKRADAIGSIGVMVSFIDFSGYYEKQGAKVITEYSTLSSEKNKAFEELLKGKPELYIKTELDPIAEEFISDIKSVRSGVPENVFKGGTWNAEDSLKNNLIDEIGTLQDAVDKVYDLSKVSNKPKNNPKSKKKTMSKKTKSFPLIQGILGITGEGIPTLSTMSGKSGIQIKEANLEVLEKAIEDKDKAVTAANGKVTTAEGKVTEFETAVTKAVTDAGLTDAGSTEANLKLLSGKVIEFGKKPGAKGTIVPASGDNTEEEEEGSTAIYESLKK